jgi:hypothetical protein
MWSASRFLVALAGFVRSTGIGTPFPLEIETNGIVREADNLLLSAYDHRSANTSVLTNLDLSTHGNPRRFRYSQQ